MRWAPLVLFLGCASPPPPSPAAPSIKDLVGKPLGDVIQALELSDLDTIHEPPGVCRGFEGRTPEGHEVYVYIRRGEAPFNKMSEWTVEKLKDLKVIGVALRPRSRWIVEGEVIWYYHSN